MLHTKLCIDAGHGLSNTKPGVFDSGAAFGGFREADIALQWALTVKQFCVDAGIPFFLTRPDNATPDPVGRRDDIAEKAGCSHFLSIHLNEGGGTGCEAFYRDAVDSAWAKVCLGAVISATGLVNRGAKREGESQHSRLAVFDFDGPCTLVEIGFVDNLTDRSLILLKETRAAFAARVVAALVKYRSSGVYS